jgi:hypothetical protein
LFVTVISSASGAGVSAASACTLKINAIARMAHKKTDAFFNMVLPP